MKLPYFIAECGVAHEGSLVRAMELIWAAREAGADAVKFQCYKADTLAAKNSPTYFSLNGQPAETQHEFFSRYDGFEHDDYERLAVECAKAGIDFGCTVFTPADVAWVDPLVKWHKIASADITNLPLLEAVAQTGKPVYLSTGAATKDEIRGAIHSLRGCPVIAMHCVLSYPTPNDQAQLGVIGQWLDECMSGRSHFRDFLGYSDHTLFNLDVLTTAWLLGATVIEKHFTLDKSLPGNDHYHSMDPTDLRALVAKFQELQTMIGDGEKRVLKIEEPARLYARRGLYAARDIVAGKILEAADIAILRPSANLGPERYHDVIGQPISQARVAGEPL